MILRAAHAERRGKEAEACLEIHDEIATEHRTYE